MQSDYDRAVALAKSGRLHEAQELLFGLEDERSERLLEKVNKAIAARGTSGTIAQPKAKNVDMAAAVAEGMKQAEKAKAQEKSKQMGYGCLALLAMCGVCWLAIMFSMPQEPQSSIKAVCEWQEMVAPSTSCTPERILRDYRPMVDACYAVWHSHNPYNAVEWSNCLENKSVDLID